MSKNPFPLHFSLLYHNLTRPGLPHACRSIATHAKCAVHILCRTYVQVTMPPSQLLSYPRGRPRHQRLGALTTDIGESETASHCTLPWKKACKPSSSNFEMHGSPMHRHQLHVCFVPGRPAVVNRSKRNGGAARSISVSMRSSS